MKRLALSLALCPLLAGCFFKHAPRGGASAVVNEPSTFVEPSSLDRYRVDYAKLLTPHEALFRLLTTNQLEQSQSESSAEYRRRMARIHPGTNLFFVQISPRLIQYEYNAENSRMHVFTPLFGSRAKSDCVKLGDDREDNLRGEFLQVINLEKLPDHMRFRSDRSLENLGLTFPIERGYAQTLFQNRALTLVLVIQVADLRNLQPGLTPRWKTLPTLLQGLMVVNPSEPMVLASQFAPGVMTP